MYYEQELYHHGIKGQRWGVRRFQNENGTRTSAGKKRYANTSDGKQIKEKRREDVKKRRSLSDADIKKKVDRLKLEKEYKGLVDADVNPGKRFASRVLSSAGEKVLTTVAAGAMAYAVKVAMTKKFNAKEAAEYIAANPNKKKK